MKTILLTLLAAAVLCATPTFTLTVTPSGPVSVAPGGVFIWTYSLENTSSAGELLSLQNVSFSSFTLGVLTELVSANPPFLAPAESFTGDLAQLNLSPNPALPSQSGQFIFTVEFLDSEFNTVDIQTVSRDFTVNVVPEPSTWTLLSAAGLGLLARRRRR